MSAPPLRDNAWLESRFQFLWTNYYADVRRGFPITVKFGRAARYRYGSICNVGRECRITMNGLFAHPEVPEYVVDATLAHELAHYVHGYGSGLPKLHAHPHRGGVIDKEMQKRGCFYLEEQAAVWRREHWQSFYERQAAGTVSREDANAQLQRTQWDAYLATDGFRTQQDLEERLADLAPRFGITEPGFTVTWLYASPRRLGLSYRFRSENVVRLHAVLANTRVPDEIIDYEICYWLAVETAGGRWSAVEQAMRDAGVWASAERAIQWRRKVWPRYRPANLPLKSK